MRAASPVSIRTLSPARHYDFLTTMQRHHRGCRQGAAWAFRNDAGTESEPRIQTSDNQWRRRRRQRTPTCASPQRAGGGDWTGRPGCEPPPPPHSRPADRAYCPSRWLPVGGVQLRRSQIRAGAARTSQLRDRLISEHARISEQVDALRVTLASLGTVVGALRTNDSSN